MTGWETGWGLEFLVFMNGFGGRTLDLILEPLHWIGGAFGYTVMLPVLFWSVDDRLSRRLYLLLMSSALVNGIFKVWWARPRPYQIDPDRISPAHVESSFGIPSGHAQGASVFGLFFAGRTRNRWVKLTLYLIIFLMGISRMVFGVHFLQDVLAGWLLGAAIFFIFVKTEAVLLNWIISTPIPALFGMALIPAVLVLIIEGIVTPIYPATRSVLATGGGLTGILTGMVLEARNGFYRSDGVLWKRILRIPAGMASVIGVQLGMSAVFSALTENGDSPVRVVIPYILQFVIVGFSAYWLIPEIFIRLKLADPRERIPR